MNKIEDNNEKVIGETLSICPKCKSILDALLIVRANKVIVKTECPQHGVIEGILYDNYKRYIDIKKVIESNKKSLDIDILYDEDVKKKKKYIKFKDAQALITSVHINLTNRCNLKCPNCWASAAPDQEDANEISLEVIKEQLNHLIQNRKNKKNKMDLPMVVLIGGEPTLRKDLKTIIHEISEMGFNTRLSTNGILLKDKEFFRSLVDAGLDWVLLQFDGFKSSTSLKFRNKDLIKDKFEVLKNASELNIKMHLIEMVSKNVNDDELYKAIEYGFNTPNVYAVNFYPLSNLGRYSEDSTSALEIIDKLEQQSNGDISYKDFLEAKKLWNRLYKYLKKPLLRQKLCTYPIFFYKQGEHIFPINRLFKLKNIIRHPIFSLRYFLKLFRLPKWADKPSKDFLYLNIEDFYNEYAMDLKEAYDCHNVFLTKEGFMPFCIYNSLYRDTKCI
ncbi:MAG: radical SAM protein [Promethearchaeota archaeon]